MRVPIMRGISAVGVAAMVAVMTATPINAEAEEKDELPPTKGMTNMIIQDLLERSSIKAEKTEIEEVRTHDDFMSYAKKEKKRRDIIKKREEERRRKEEAKRKQRQKQSQATQVEKLGRRLPGHPEQSERKTWMSWRAVTNTASAQYKLLSQSHVGNYGIMTYNGRYAVALGSYYADRIGEELTIKFDTGQTIPVIVGDFKADVHTDNSNRIALRNKDVVEFIVSTPDLHPNAARDGSFHTIFPGKVVEIIKHE